MTFLNTQEREALLNELKGVNFNRAKGKLSRMDTKGRLAFYRNNQRTGRWMTRFELPTLGTRVTLVEAMKVDAKSSKAKPEFDLIEIVVEPTPDNRT